MKALNTSGNLLPSEILGDTGSCGETVGSDPKAVESSSK